MTKKIIKSLYMCVCQHATTFYHACVCVCEPPSSMESPSESCESMTPSQYDDSDLEVEAELPALKDSISESVLKKLKPKEKKRQEVLNGKKYADPDYTPNTFFYFSGN